jgi:Putative death-receptor fusion protein (DUF2428)
MLCSRAYQVVVQVSGRSSCITCRGCCTAPPASTEGKQHLVKPETATSSVFVRPSAHSDGLAPAAQLVLTASWLTMKEVALLSGALAASLPPSSEM